MVQRPLLLPWPPTVNTYWRHVVMGKRVATIMSAAGRQYRVRAEREIEAWRSKGNYYTILPTDRLAVELHCFPPDRRARDLDNLPKALLDALKHNRLITDDAQIDLLTTARGPIVKGGCVKVLIRVMNHGELQLGLPDITQAAA